MNLTKKQKIALQEIGLYKYALIEHDGKAYYTDKDGEKEFIIPQFGEILQTMFESIKEAGFTDIKRCVPSEANCIIRVFQELHHQYDFGMCFNAYGAECYTKLNGVWVTNSGTVSGYDLKFDQHRIRHILQPDESVYLDTDFLDCYVQIS